MQLIGVDVCLYCEHMHRRRKRKYDLTKYYRYVTRKSSLCYIACAWDCHSLHEARLFEEILTQKNSDRNDYILLMMALLEMLNFKYIRKYMQKRIIISIIM